MPIEEEESFQSLLAFGSFRIEKGGGGVDGVKYDKIRPKDSHQSHAHLSNSFFFASIQSHLKCTTIADDTGFIILFFEDE